MHLKITIITLFLVLIEIAMTRFILSPGRESIALGSGMVIGTIATWIAAVLSSEF